MTNEAGQDSNPYTKLALVLAFGSLLFILANSLLLVLISGLLIHELVYLLEPILLRYLRVKSDFAKILVVAFFAVVTITLLLLASLGIANFFHSGNETIPALMTEMADILQGTRTSLPSWATTTIPENVDELKTGAIRWLQTHAQEITVLGKEAGRTIVLLIIGMVMGAMVALRELRGGASRTAFTAALIRRARNLADSFGRVVFAQTKIASINAIFTGVYLAILLPAFGVHLPFLKTIILLTLLFGLLPIIGNLVTNTIIVIVSLSHSLAVAFASLVFLMVIHKLEYFLNARIVGGEIKAKAWELLIAMLALESVFGVSGVVAAPIFYAYLKTELTEAKLI